MSDNINQNPAQENPCEQPEQACEPQGECQSQKDAPTEKKTFFKELLDWLETFACAFALVIILFVFVFRIVTVDGYSMHYTLDHGDKLLISNLFYTPEYGDIVILKNDATGNRAIIKRVIATEGQTVDINFKTWEITVDGKKLDEPYINDEERLLGYDLVGSHYTFPLVVEENCVFVLGDNRNHSSDSRYFGQFSREEISGRVLFRILPLNYFGKVSDSSDQRIAEIKAKH